MWEVQILENYVYGSNDLNDRKELWNDLRYLARMVNGPKWIILGDFIEVLFSHERVNGQDWLMAHLNFVACW